MKMQRLQVVKYFVVDQAHYRLEDGHGHQVALTVDYQRNRYELGQLPAGVAAAFQDEVRRLAQGLLQRKHAANLAEREQFI